AVSAVSRSGPLLANTAVTNVPGSPVPQYFHGAKIVKSTGCVPLSDGLGLFHCVTSFCSEFTFMFTACRQLLPDVDTYRLCIERSLDDLRTAATGPAPATKRSKPRTARPAAARDDS
ncbi:MAG: WS/DGAT domain-containing protein, partial [Acidimicrobiia bacterium]